MKLTMEGRSYENSSFSKFFKSAKYLVVFLFLVALIDTAKSEQKSDDMQPFQATRAVEDRAASTSQPVAMKQRVDRMAILVHQRNEILSKLNNFYPGSDKAVLAQIQEDLKSIDLEIALVSWQPVYPTSGVTSSQDDGAKQVSSSQTENEESQPKESEKVTYESWDIFKNFGSKGNE
ncbi:MAG TPA: hypothetical protein ACQGQH_08840 [Xylella sp.]